MSIAQSARVHPTALIDPQAEIGDDARIGAFAIVEGPVRVGPNCDLRARSHLIGPLALGRNNTVFENAVLGEQPQHVRYAGELTRLEIGDNNTFRENVTIHRGTTHSGRTKIGNNNFFMAGAHVAHDCVIGHGCILANGALLGGHCLLEDNVFLSGNSAVHQFVRIGRLALLSGVSGATKDVPPFIIQQRINCVVGVNVVGMRRAGIPTSHIDAIRRAYHAFYRTDMTLPKALSHVEQELGTVPEVAEMVGFIRASTRGISLNIEREAA